MRIAICDDSAFDRDLIHELLQATIDERGLHAEMVHYDSGINLLYDVEDGDWFDVVFLDMIMSNHLGIDVAHRLRDLKYMGAIIFLTSTKDFAVDSYDVNAAGYLLKPLSYEKLSKVMDKVCVDFEEETYPVKKRAKIIRVPVREILFIESSNSKCLLHRSDGTTYTMYKKLDVVEEELKDERFLRCHQSYLVNMDHIKEMDKSFILDSGDPVMIRQRSLRSVRDEYLAYVAKKEALMAAIGAKPQP